jgi:hypothetical protein
LSIKEVDPMTGSLLVLLLVTAQDRPKPDTPEDRARRAALVDRVMAAPSPPDLRPRRPAVAEGLEDGRRREVQDRNRDENPFENEKPRALVVPQLPAVRPGARPQRYLTLESATPAPVEESDDLDQREPIPPVHPVLNVKKAVLGRENFDRWIYGDGVGEDQRRTFLYSRLATKVDIAVHELHLNVPQRDKLRLAGMGDIKRFFDRVQERRLEFELARRDLTAGRWVLSQLLALSDEFQAGPFGDGSLFAKTLRKMENEARNPLRIGP